MLKPKFTSILIIVLVSILLFPACTPEISEAVEEGAVQQATPVVIANRFDVYLGRACHPSDR